MTKIDHIRHFLTEEKAELAIFSDPVTVNYLTGFACDPHERQMFLFIYEQLHPYCLFLHWRSREPAKS